MLSPYKESFEFGIRVCTAVVTSTVAVLVYLISRQQSRTSREKLRLDLYDKRLAVYMRTLDLYEALLGWKDEPEQVALIGPFYRAYREAKFLFPEASGVYSFMDEFSKHAFQVTNFKATQAAWGETFPKERVELAMARSEHVNWLFGSLSILEERLAPFLNFHAGNAEESLTRKRPRRFRLLRR